MKAEANEEAKQEVVAKEIAEAVLPNDDETDAKTETPKPTEQTADAASSS